MHEQFLLAALEQATLGQGRCAPNPCVGAVAVRNGAIIAQAWHQGAGSPHAEHLLLAQFPPKTPGVSVYITLEPCNHWGRTPPCVDALIHHGVDEVIFAYMDPNPIVAKNRSSERLEEKGIKVLHYPMPQINEFYKSYTHWMQTKTPRVTVKMAQSLDGKIGFSSARAKLSNAACEEFTHLKRAATDIILTSAKTILIDNPLMNVRLNETVTAKHVAILDPELRLDSNAAVFSSAAHCHIYHLAGRHANYPNSSFYPMPESEGHIDLKAVLNHLGELGMHDVWVEVGGAIFSSLHHQGLVHKTYLYIVPVNLGHNSIQAYQKPGMFDPKHRITWIPQDDNMIACIDWQED